MVHVSAGPPAIPDGGLSPVRFCPWLPYGRLPIQREAQVLTHIHPCTPWFAAQGAPLFPGPTCPGTPGAAKCPEPLCTSKALPRSSWSLSPRQQALPCCHCSYGLMRQSSTLLVLRCYPRTPGLCRLRSAPAGRRTFPTLSLRICPCVLGPLPRWLLRCMYPFLPPRQRPSPRSDRVGAPPCPCSDFSTAPVSRLQSFAHVQARRCARHPDRSYRYGIHRMAAVVFTSEPLTGCYLPVPRICLPSESGN
jgi:hypothetical protein